MSKRHEKPKRKYRKNRILQNQRNQERRKGRSRMLYESRLVNIIFKKKNIAS
ncbi:hypothetical protein Hanom_Chr15g01372591 [Helianthus anomalus]